MSELLLEDKEFKRVNFTESRLKKGSYENSNLSEIIFAECEFIECDLKLSYMESEIFN